VEVAGIRRHVFLHCSQVQPVTHFTPSSVGRKVRFDHIQSDDSGRPQIIGALFPDDREEA
jgi:hypothetical protein